MSDRFFERFLGLIENAEEELDVIEYRQLLSDINRTSKDKLERLVPISPKTPVAGLYSIISQKEAIS